MNDQIQAISYYAEHILKNCTKAAVHSVYRRTINITDGKRLVSLQAAGSALSPISLISRLSQEDMELLPAAPGDRVRFHEGRLEIKSAGHVCRFFYGGAKRQDLTLSKPLEPSMSGPLAAAIQTALSLTNAGGFAPLFREGPKPEGLSLMLCAAKERMQQSRCFLSRADWEKGAAALAGLVGLGTGLTPSGDDFLCGVLAGLSLSGRGSHRFTQCLETEISGRLSDTIDISAAFLACALEHNYSLPVCRLAGLPPAADIQAAFEKIGHSSGMDTLCGIFWGLQPFP